MKYFPLIWAALWRRPTRLILTLLSVSVAFTLFGVTIGFNASVQNLVARANLNRVFVGARFGGGLPVAYEDQIAHVPGVRATFHWSGLSAYYQDKKNNVSPLMVRTDTGGEVMTEQSLTPADWNHLSQTRNGLVVSKLMAARYGFKLGDQVPLLTATSLRQDGGKTWPFIIVGIVDDIPEAFNGFAIGNYDYLDQARPLARRGNVGGIQVLVNDASQADSVARAIDAKFVNSGTPTNSMSNLANSEAAAQAGINIPFVTTVVASAGLFMILFLTGNGIAQSVRERIPEFAMLKTLGFSDAGVMALVFVEAAIPCLLGAAIGIAIAKAFAQALPHLFPPNLGLPVPYMSPAVLSLAFVFAVIVAFLSAILPALRIKRLDVAAALSGDKAMLRQIAAVTILNFKSLPNRFWPSLVIVVGMACVVGVLISMLSLTTGYVQSEMKAGDPGRAIVIADGIENESASSLTRDQANIIMDGPGIKKDTDGAPLAEGEVMVSAPATRKSGVVTYILIRGFGAKGAKLRPEFKIIAGRMYHPGSQEMIIGKAAMEQFAGMNLGDKIILPNGQWPIVGEFATGGDILEGELIADRDTLMAAVRRTAFNSVLARLESAPDSMDKLKTAVTSNPALSVIAERHSTYYEHFSGPNATLFSAVAYTVGGIMAIGALFGALNTMFAAVSARAREIATLRAIGFSGFAVAVSVVMESLLLALSGALIGSAIAWTLFNNSQKAYFNNVFDLKVTPALIGLGLAWALVVALLGGLLPSIRAARLPLVDALRAT